MPAKNFLRALMIWSKDKAPAVLKRTMVGSGGLSQAWSVPLLDAADDGGSGRGSLVAAAFAQRHAEGGGHFFVELHVYSRSPAIPPLLQHIMFLVDVLLEGARPHRHM